MTSILRMSIAVAYVSPFLIGIHSAGQQLQNWKSSLPEFVHHVDSVRMSPGGAKKVPVVDNALAVAMMASTGGCMSKSPNQVFGPVVEFEGRLDSVTTLIPAKNNASAAHGLALTFPKTDPGILIYAYPNAVTLSAWRAVESGASIRFRASLSCLVAIKFGDITAYSITLTAARPLK